jgi:hypothetical protein
VWKEVSLDKALLHPQAICRNVNESRGGEEITPPKIDSRATGGHK